ncbi:MAG: RidA family protein [Pseudomonadota bacterium]
MDFDKTFMALAGDLSPAAPVASYVPCRQVGDLVFVSGQLPIKDGALLTGVLGTGVITTEQAKEGARLCGLSALAHLRNHLASLNRVRAVVFVGGMVAASPDFTEHPQIINGFSDLMVQVFGETGQHARAAYGVASLPLGASVEVAATFAVAAS